MGDTHLGSNEKNKKAKAFLLWFSKYPSVTYSMVGLAILGMGLKAIKVLKWLLKAKAEKRISRAVRLLALASPPSKKSIEAKKEKNIGRI